MIVGRLVVGGPTDSLSEASGSMGSGTDFGRSLVGVIKLGIALGNSVRDITVRSCILTIYVVRSGGVGSRCGSGVGHISITEHPWSTSERVQVERGSLAYGVKTELGRSVRPGIRPGELSDHE